MPNTALNRTEVLLLTNKSGGDLVQGDVVIIDSANAAAVTTTTTSGYTGGGIGVVFEPNGIASNAVGLVAFAGYVPKITLSGSASLGDLIKTHSVAKQAVRHTSPPVQGDFGQVLGTGTTPAAFIFSNPVPQLTGVVTPYPPKTFSGLVLANNGGDASNDIDIGIGGCRDDADTQNLILSGAMTKRLDAAWAAGTNQGALDTGAKGANTWYYYFLIRKDSDGSIDVLISASLASPTMPAGYSTKQFIGAVQTNASSNIRPFIQTWNRVEWNDGTLTPDVAVTNLSTSAVDYVLVSIPLGMRLRVFINIALYNASSSMTIYVRDTDVVDLQPHGTNYPLATLSNPSNMYVYLPMILMVGTAAKISARSSGASTTFKVAVLGWEYIR